MKLSIGMIVKNEEKYLDKCLTALQPILEQVDSELIIVDTGSTDNTVDIAKKHTDKVYFFEWINDFAAARNESLKHALGEWFLFIDADEILKDTTEIIHFFNSMEYKKYNSASIIINNTTHEKVHLCSPVFLTRLNKLYENTKFKGIIHEYIPFKEPTKVLKSTIFDHFGYAYTNKKDQIKKGNRNISLLLSRLSDEPNNPLLRSQISDTYYLLDDFDSAIFHALKGIELCYELNDFTFYTILQFNKIRYYYNKNDYLSIVNECKKYLEKKSNTEISYIDAYYYLSFSYYKLAQYEECTETFEKYFILYEKYIKTPYDDNNNARALDFINYSSFINLSFCGIDSYIKLKNYSRAKKLLDNKYLTNYSEIDNINSLFKLELILMNKNNNYSRIETIYNNIIKNNYDEIIISEFEYAIDSYLNYEKEDNYNNIMEVLSRINLNRDYIKYSKIRKMFLDNTIDMKNEITNLISNCNKLDSKYKDILYISIKNNISLKYLNEKLSIELIRNFTGYSYSRYEDFINALLCYYANNPDEKFVIYHISEIVLSHINKNDMSSNYKEILNIYYETFNYTMDKIYPNIDESNISILNFLPYNIRFGYYLNMYNKVKTSDIKACIQYLNKALKEYEDMKGIVELLLMEINYEEKSYNDKKNEFDELAIAVKKQIKMFIKSNDINTAKSLLEQYKQINPSDEDIANLETKINSK